MSVKVEVGKRYIDGTGAVIKIVDDRGEDKGNNRYVGIPDQGATDPTYGATGSYFAGITSRFDLVEEAGDNNV